MPLGTSMLRGSHCGSNCTGDDCGCGWPRLQPASKKLDDSAVA
jgi:hypothetical protein